MRVAGESCTPANERPGSAATESGPVSQPLAKDSAITECYPSAGTDADYWLDRCCDTLEVITLTGRPATELAALTLMLEGMHRSGPPAVGPGRAAHAHVGRAVKDTALVYRLPPELSDAEVGAMFAAIERGALPLAVMGVREQLWRKGGASARISNRLSRNAAHRMESSQ